MYDAMKSPISIGRLQLSNRVVMPAMGVNLSARGGGVSDDIIVTGAQPVTSSLFPGESDKDVRELSAEECGELAQAFVDGAVAAQMAGADGVELHGPHSYLINQYKSRGRAAL